MDLEKELRDLAERTAQIRHQFLRAELASCFVALEMAEFEPANCNTPIAKREVAATANGITVTERFLAETSGAEKSAISAIEEELAGLTRAFKAMTQKVNSRVGLIYPCGWI